jgi:hypothetical protein
MHLLKIMLKANGRCGVPQGGVISQPRSRTPVPETLRGPHGLVRDATVLAVMDAHQARVGRSWVRYFNPQLPSRLTSIQHT